ncbi:DNA-binding MarR family transcriptional regulator [Kribbella voronezhensis]|uniref:DNA-binding MarR family transcriptional regulator n=1 Tax=Kribbella voronezhensis TaxID=2512212 RepID=A0A4R7TEN0_9ACTN|nr:MarR family transcriptional regulator [Kribbella voronezhensis]TDU90624.1 DNA-binding MarR family transcriptional regulator [Kribbella voronezhensis]
MTGDRVDQLIAAWQRELPSVLYPTTELTKRVMLLADDLSEVTRRVLRDVGLTTAEFDVLVSLRRAGTPYRMKPSDLSRNLLLSSGGTSNVTNQLAGRGLVVREPDPDDGRGTQIRLTEQGIEAAERAVQASAAAHDEMWSELPPETVQAAAEALRALFVTDRPAARTGTRS